MAMTYNSLVADLEDYLDRSDARLIAQIPNFINLGEIRCAREVKNLGLKTTANAVFQPGTYAYQKPNRWLETISINFGTNKVYRSVTQGALTNGIATVTLSEAHDFEVGDQVTVSGLSTSTFNGLRTISAVTQNSISYSFGAGTQAVIDDTGGYIYGPLENRQYLKPRSYEFCCAYWPDRTQSDTPKYYADYDFGYLFVVPTPAIAYPFEIAFFQRPIPLSVSNQTNWFTEFAPDMLLYAALLEAVPYLKNDQRIQTWKDYYMQASSSIKIENRERINDATIKRVE